MKKLVIFLVIMFVLIPCRSLAASNISGANLFQNQDTTNQKKAINERPSVSGATTLNAGWSYLHFPTLSGTVPSYCDMAVLIDQESYFDSDVFVYSLSLNKTNGFWSLDLLSSYSTSGLGYLSHGKHDITVAACWDGYSWRYVDHYYDSVKILPDGGSNSWEPIYRFWSDSYSGHFFTSSGTEARYVSNNYPSNVWRYEKINYWGYNSLKAGATPVYRFWSDSYRHHFYTNSYDEYLYVLNNYPSNVWRYEGIAYYAISSYDGQSLPVYRFWSDAYKGHFYTASLAERDYIIANYPSSVWRYEGIGFYIASQGD